MKAKFHSDHFPTIYGEGKQFAYDRNSSIIHYIKIVANQFPENTAITDDNGSYTYAALFNAVKLMASKLNSVGVSQSDKVALLMEPSCELIVVTLAILSLGACYIPIDSEYPIKRIEYIINDSSPKLLITNFKKNSAHLLNLPVTLFDLQTFSDQVITNRLTILPEISGETPAYIIYTSGSTGMPKGIIVSHRSVNNHMLWMKNQFGFNNHDKFLLKTPLTFDPSVWEIFLPLYIGTTLIIAKAGTHINLNSLIGYIKEHHITVLQLVPAILHRLVHHPEIQSCQSLRYIFVGGESLTAATKKQFFMQCTCELINLYGPAEATIDSTFHIVKNTKEEIDHDYIGAPIYNTNIYILDAELKPCNADQVGEICISGDNLSLGYLNKAELTQQNFITNPLLTDGIIYRTGDLAKWNERGIIEYIGRTDLQIKNNGVRIETESLKSVIMKVDNVYDCYFEKQVSHQDMYSILTCYIIPIAGLNVDINQIKQQLMAQFPNYMIPKKFHLVEKINLSCNGKISTRSINLLNKIAAKNDEDKLYHIWNNVLNVSIHDESANFFDCGGDSITCYVLADEISKTFLITANPEDIIKHPSIKKQLAFIKHMREGQPKTQEKDVLVELNTHGQQKAFFIHPIGGTVFWYVHLAKLLKGYYHIYGISDPGLTSGNTLFSSIEEMAEFYTNIILEADPIGPYVLGGASFGATIAVEIARNLVSMQKKIKPLLIFDGWAIYPKKLQDLNYFKESMISQQNDWVKKFKISNAQQIEFDKAFKVQCHRVNLLLDYHMQKITFPIEIFKSKELLPLFRPFNSTCNYWDKYASNYRLHLVPGNHETMFIKPHVNALATQLLMALR